MCVGWKPCSKGFISGNKHPKFSAAGTQYCLTVHLFTAHGESTSVTKKCATGEECHLVGCHRHGDSGHTVSAAPALLLPYSCPAPALLLVQGQPLGPELCIPGLVFPAELRRMCQEPLRSGERSTCCKRSRTEPSFLLPCSCWVGQGDSGSQGNSWAFWGVPRAWSSGFELSGRLCKTLFAIGLSEAQLRFCSMGKSPDWCLLPAWA